MIFRLIILIVIGVMVYRFFGGKVPILDKIKPKKDKNSDEDFTKAKPTSKCAECGTYMTEDDAIIYQKKSYCSKECLEKAQKR